MSMPSSLLGETGTVAESVGDGVVAKDFSDVDGAQDVVHVMVLSSTESICRSWSSVGQQ